MSKRVGGNQVGRIKLVGRLFCYGKDLSLTAHLKLSSIDVTMFKMMIKDGCASTCMQVRALGWLAKFVVSLFCSLFYTIMKF